MACSAVGRKKRTWKNQDVRMTGCTKFFNTAGHGHGKIAANTP
jgi:hypothetical protein